MQAPSFAPVRPDKAAATFDQTTELSQDRSTIPIKSCAGLSSASAGHTPPPSLLQRLRPTSKIFFHPAPDCRLSQRKMPISLLGLASTAAMPAGKISSIRCCKKAH